MTSLAKILLVLLPVAGSEFVAKWWTEPPPPDAKPEILALSPPPDSPDWKILGDLYREVRSSLRCSNGWLSDVTEPDGPGMRIAYFAWDETTTINTLEAFQHPPEQCMGSIGMKMEKVHAPRRYRVGNQTLVFDSTQFRPHSGGTSVNIFKCVWVEGFDAPDLRAGVIWGSTGLELRQLRIATAATRFKPRHTRVIMGAVAGMPSEELAWHRFSSGVLSHLMWNTSSSTGATSPEHKVQSR